jgi:hypothetical protein
MTRRTSDTVSERCHRSTWRAVVMPFHVATSHTAGAPRRSPQGAAGDSDLATRRGERWEKSMSIDTTFDAFLGGRIVSTLGNE